MKNILLTIQHGTSLFSPPIKDEIKIEWERNGSPGKLTFTTIKVPNGGMAFTEGDEVCFYYDDKPIFKGYVFTKKRDRQHHIEVTCYDKIRYLKNKYSYVFENKTATQIVQALCKDFNLSTGDLENTSYIIPSIAEENISAIDIILSALEETCTNTGNLFVLYDDFGNIIVKDSANMVSDVLICETTGENFDYTSSIDEETYNSIVLYYKNYDNSMKIYNASSPSKISEWGTLRYFEEVKQPSVGKNKANNLLNLYCRKTRDLTVRGAFGEIGVRAGTLIPVKLDLGDIITNNYMLVDRVIHKFSNNKHTMDLTLQGAWEKDNYTVEYREEGEVKENPDTDITIITSGGVNTSGNANADYILKTLVANGATVSGACGVLANVEAESNFSTALNNGDGGLASGLCQWHPDRFSNLTSYCNSKGLSNRSLEGQTAFMIYELKQYPSTWSAICNGSGIQGARDAAYLMCVKFERPSNKEAKGRQRANTAEKYWYIYGG